MTDATIALAAAQASAASATLAATAVDAVTARVADAYALIVSDLGTTDGQTRALVEAGASQTTVALAARYAGLTSVNARARLATPGATATDNRTILAAAVNDASTAGAPLSLRGAFPVTGGVIVPSGAVTIDAQNATLTQTDNLSTILTLKSGSRLSGGTFVGKGTDYVNSGAVIAAAAIKIDNGADDVVLMNVKGTNLAGSGVRAATGVTRLKLLFCDFSGVGTAGGIIPVSSKDGGGLALVGQNNADIQVLGGSYRGFPQGLSVGSVTNVTVGGGVKLDAIGQHGMYFESITGGIISGWEILSSELEGFKSNIETPSPYDTDQLVIGQGVMRSSGSHGIHLPNGEIPIVHGFKRVVISDVTIQAAPGGTGDGVLLENVSGGASVNNVRVDGGRRGLRVLNSSRVDVNGFDAVGYTETGVHLDGVKESSVNRFSLSDGSTNLAAVNPYSVLVLGATSQDLAFSNGRLFNGTGAAKHLFYVAAGDMTKMSFSFLRGQGATDYGFRGPAATASRMWIGNDLNGGLGKFLNPPTNAAAIADTSGAALATLEAEVNKLKARMRLAGIVA